ncbi:amino acid ABC transporter substrate-binding protein (PAAT family) [Bradyrhizobium sp. R2.2-H]|jgi:polar amino acid transport system substrate-binding protein|uniref:substrate-binding periplasmic protein n=1 Tax=unclassified Bradyrhizobium TaxID=2631580 RepID=UPI0010433E7A|nr:MULTISPECIES: transporter substrate-binding domain-containing protein [unclassified Bradyrhizobium]TCU63191.1 amino acid ABC transporter substrate-binding protein (PAAT family) [Bradyrhizobium sp. Y-H1]TCU65335.1 amino acid ABC transporter substrate-binding protein (PAAT family) [Bradyrhizobium sp. R2.2-H]
MKAIVPVIVAAAIGLPGPAQARALDAIRASGVIGLCAHPNSLPFARKTGEPPGFQVELGQVLARELGVALRLDWIITQYQMRSAGCDILLDVIADRDAQGETRLRISKPYYRTGVALAVPSSSPLTSFKSLNERTKVGVQVGSIAAMIIGQRRVPLSTFGFESDSLEAVSNREIDAAAVTPTAAGYFNLTHPDNPLRILDRDESIADLNWNVAVGMIRPDDALREAIDRVLDRLRSDGTIDRIYRRYGIVLQAPR